MRILRVYHGGRDAHHRARERALVRAGVDLTLVVPTVWPGGSAEVRLSPEPFRVVELPIRRTGDVNRHVYRDSDALRHVIREAEPTILDVHEEPFSLASRQWLRATSPALPIVMYSAQNVDKRFPPPFAQHERAAHRRVSGLYPCTNQAASVARGKGFGGTIAPLPLGYDERIFQFGDQSLSQGEVVLLLVGRLVPEKGVEDAVRVLARVHKTRPARLVLCGAGDAIASARALATALEVGDRVEHRTWQAGVELSETYRSAHVLLIPSRVTSTWTEQFGRVITEAQACGAVVAGYASGSIPEVAGDAGLLVATGNHDTLSMAVARLLADPQNYSGRREAGRRQVATRTWDAVAKRQIALYDAVAELPIVRRPLARSPRRRRRSAHAEFGPTAPTAGGLRPFALPILRRGGVVAGALATALDTTGELLAPLRRDA